MDFRTYLQNNLVILDGGMGTLLQAAGLEAGELPERWNLTHPDVVEGIHRAYFNAGSNVVNANTFGANPLKMTEEELDAVVGAGIALARRAAETSTTEGEKFVALDIGPTGRLLAPLGDLDFEDAVAAFAAVVRLGVKHGADLIFVETMNDSYEAKAALLAARENSDLPVLVSCAFGGDGKLMTGASPAAAAVMLEGMGADALGANCSLGPRALAPTVRELLAVSSTPVLFKPNAGLPRVEGGQTVFDVPPEVFAAEIADLVAAGVRLVGGCCGTTPAYIEALVREIRRRGLAPQPIPSRTEARISSYTHAVTIGGEGGPVLIGERINPTGKKRFKEALHAHDMGYILEEGLRQVEAGAQVLDVNVGLPGLDETALLTEAVCELQAVTDLPLQVDTADPAAMESALRRYNGKALVNSVSGKQASLDSVLPLVKKYGGVVVALTLDESGIPETPEGRLAIARRILAAAEDHGISARDVIFDPLAMAVSAAPDAAAVTLRSIECIKRETGRPTSLGVSNVSFGLPGRDAVNAAFFTLALAAGLDAAILNPFSPDMMRAYHTYRLLLGRDENCMGYLAFHESNPTATATTGVTTASTAGVTATESGRRTLKEAIMKGLRAEAATLCQALLETEAPLSVVESQIIPALDAVGESFEKKTTFLPQLLMSAEAAGAAFEVIRTAARAAASDGMTATPQKPPIVLATVKGDIHDIGKNIVRLLLENYGYPVTDLGRDVPPKAVVEAVTRLHAPIVGLSALMTTTVPSMEETIRALRAAAPETYVIVGGAVLTADYAAAIGADAYAADAMETVRLAEAITDRRA